MPRPEVKPVVDLKSFAIIGGLVMLVVTAGCVGALLLGGSQGAPDEEAPSDEVEQTDSDGSTEDATVANVKDVEGLDTLKFLDRDAKIAFKQALASYCSDNEISVADPKVVSSSETDAKATSAKIYLSVNESDYLICYWVSGTSSPFMFAQATESQVAGLTGVNGSSSSANDDDDDVSADTADDSDDVAGSTGSASSSSGAASSRTESSITSSSSSSSTTSSTSGSSSSSKSSKSSSGKTTKKAVSVKSPVKASNAEKLAKKLPEKAAYYLPTVIENYMDGKGVSVDGDDAVIDYASIAKSKLGWTMKGYVKDSSGKKHSLDIEWNKKKEKFGIGTW